MSKTHFYGRAAAKLSFSEGILRTFTRVPGSSLLSMIHELDPIWKMLRSTSVQQPPRRRLVFPHADPDAQLAQLQPRQPMRRDPRAKERAPMPTDD